LAGKPVMEGKAVLFKKFANVNAVDIELDTTDLDQFIKTVKLMEPTFGGINLEDIKGPDCFYVETKLKEIMNIPVFHDDQHGTAIIALAGLINCMDIFEYKIEDIKVVCNGAGAAGIAIINLLKSYGVQAQNVIVCDTKGVIYKGRTAGMNEFKEKHAIETEKRTLAEAMDGANVAIGVSSKGAFTKDFVKTMAKNPIIFALANPDPEITPVEAHAVREDAIVATGRSDFPNQINNVMCFPFLFRGALDVRASQINEEMKIAAAKAIAGIARLDVPKEVQDAYEIKTMKYGRDYIIPTPFDPRLMAEVSIAVAKAAQDSGIAKNPIKEGDWEKYRKHLGSLTN
jgi:malate dehydrogenase (oxaloacetate-decarboxylating)(NADP+)